MSNPPVYSHLSTHDVRDNDDDVPFVVGVEVVTNSNSNSTTGLTMVKETSNKYVGQMVAPATLPEGYELPVKLGSSQFNIQIPMGGVEQGQVFNISIPQDRCTLPSSAAAVHAASSSLPPVGVWRDSICDCFSYGVCHSHCITSMCCPLCKLI